MLIIFPLDTRVREYDKKGEATVIPVYDCRDLGTLLRGVQDDCREARGRAMQGAIAELESRRDRYTDVS